MANDLLIQPLVIDAADFPPLPLQPGFTQLASDELGNAATPTDGFDNVLAETIAIVDGLDAALGGLAGDLLDAFGEADTIDPQPVSDTADSFTASLAPSDTAVGNLGALLSGAAPLTPPGSASGGAGTCGILDMGSHPFQLSGIANFVEVTVVFNNNTSSPLTIKSTTWSPAQTYGFRIIPSIDGSVVQPGAQLPITIWAGSGDVGTTRATLTLHTDAPDPQPCLNVTAEWIAGSGPPPITKCVKCTDFICPQ